MNPFEQYMQLHRIDPVRFSILAEVRYQTVYNAMKGHPITAENAQKIRNATGKLAGVSSYTGAFVLKEQDGKQPPNFHVKKLPSQQHL